eukprot:TRINITY_DN6904_c0_g1_i2.p2 TRINITY_DN6904_c0_g1~~TRINITY_DN6904_c0_g1_i2.p2  ORF type:complete len:117 (+),score=18.37 TRINITY_DN6904_c0_g1_i2:761-1111(+)
MLSVTVVDAHMSAKLVDGLDVASFCSAPELEVIDGHARLHHKVNQLQASRCARLFAERERGQLPLSDVALLSHAEWYARLRRRGSRGETHIAAVPCTAPPAQEHKTFETPRAEAAL